MLICRHIKADGHRCGSPAVTGKPYCFFHMKLHHMDKTDIHEAPLLEDSTSIFLAITQVYRALQYGTMDLKVAGRMLYSLQMLSTIAARNEKAARLQKAEPVETVRSVHNLAGDALDFTEAARFGMDMLAPIDSEPTNDSSQKPETGSAQDTDPDATTPDAHDTAEQPGTTQDGYTVEEMEHVLNSPITDPAKFRKCVHAYSKYLDEERAKQPPPKKLSINACVGADHEPVPVSTIRGTRMSGAPCLPPLETWETRGRSANSPG